MHWEGWMFARLIPPRQPVKIHFLGTYLREKYQKYIICKLTDRHWLSFKRVMDIFLTSRSRIRGSSKRDKKSTLVEAKKDAAEVATKLRSASEEAPKVEIAGTPVQDSSIAVPQGIPEDE